MAGTTQWPSYPIGPRESIFAIGVVSVKYAELETVLLLLFRTVLSIDYDYGSIVFARAGASACSQIIERALIVGEWKDPAKEAIEHFLKAFAICTGNRNQLIHSEMGVTSAAYTVLIKLSKQGNLVMAAPKLDELKLIADEMNAYVEYGRMLSNAINISFMSPPPFPASVFPWPNKPPLPRAIEYRSGPHSLG